MLSRRGHVPLDRIASTTRLICVKDSMMVSISTKTVPAVQSTIRALIASSGTGIIVQKESFRSLLLSVQTTVCGRVPPAFHAIDSGILYYCIVILCN